PRLPHCPGCDRVRRPHHERTAQQRSGESLLSWSVNSSHQVESMASLPHIGWIGAGRMGVPMAGFILKAGYPLTIYSRSAASRAQLVAQGASEALSTQECVREADIIFAALPDDAALRDVAFGPRGVLAHARSESVFVDTSTVSP